MEYVGKKYKVEIEQDDMADNPREAWDNAGTMICFHRGYTLGDKHRYDSPRDFLEDIAEKYVTPIEIIHYEVETYRSIEETLDEDRLNIEIVNFDDWTDEELEEVIYNNVYMLNLYLYDHSGITMSTAPFSCRWDSGQVGVIYIEDKDAEKEFGKKPEETQKEFDERVYKYLRGEVETYDQYLTGEVYWFRVSKKQYFTERRVYKDAEGELTGEVDERDGVNWVEIYSCGGFYGSDFKTNGVYDAIDDEVLKDVGLFKEGK